jgi:PadR family transcriptional regulator, regulatory protein AphA
MKSKPKVIKLTGNSYAVLALLDQFGEMTSYDIKQAIEISIQNFWPVPHTTAYEEPARLATGDYLSVRQEESGRRRRFYSLTEKGREAVAAWAADPEVAPPQLREEAILKIFAGGDPEPLAESRRAWHEAKREELAGLLREVRKAEDPSLAASERTLMTGVGYHQKMLELLDLFAEGGEPGQI